MLRKIGYVVVALLFGTLGIHNFFEKNWTSGIVKLVITVCSYFLFSGWLYGFFTGIVSIWILFDILEFCINGKSYDIKKLFNKTKDIK